MFLQRKRRVHKHLQQVQRYILFCKSCVIIPCINIRVLKNCNILVFCAASPKIPKSTSYMVRSFGDVWIFNNMSAKKNPEMLKTKDCINLANFRKRFIKIGIYNNNFTLLLEVNLHERSTNMLFVWGTPKSQAVLCWTSSLNCSVVIGYLSI